MTISECVQAVLEADASLTAQVPAERIRVPGAWQGLDKPYIVHLPAGVEPVRVHGRLVPNTYRWGYELAVFAGTMGEAETIAFLAKDAMEGTHTVGSPASDQLNIQWIAGMWYGGREPENEIERFVVQFEITQTPV